MNKSHIAFILYRYPLGISSMIINSIKLFVQKGFMVDVYINRRHIDSSPIEFYDDRIKIIVYEDNQSLLLRAYIHFLHKVERLSSLLASVLPFQFKLLALFPDIFIFSKWLRKKMASCGYTYIMPVECRSLLCLGGSKETKKIVYYNLELLDWAKHNPLYRSKLVMKKMEYEMISELQHVAITSPRRAEIFCRINDYDSSKIYPLPVVPLGDAIEEKSSFFRKLFSIPEGLKIAVYAGSFQPWAKCLEIIQSVRQWPEGYVLVMHTWNKASLSSNYFLEMEKAAQGLPVYFSSAYIEYDRLAAALSSADIGLMFYDSIDQNFSEILFSSNKLGEYLRAGLGVVGSDFPSLKEFIEENGIGFVVPLDKLPEAVGQIGERLDYYRKNAAVCYREKLRFEDFFERFYAGLSGR